MKNKPSLEDLSIWKLNTQDVKPLPKLNKTIPILEAKSLPKNGRYIIPAQTREFSGVHSATPAPSLAKKDLRRIQVEATFDMHGLTLESGYHGLEKFLIRAQERGIKTVLVITGKGAIDKENTLRHQLPRWINETSLRHFVSSLHYPAKPQDGGNGAFYVHVKRKRA